ncbi:protocadherin-like wing polarity protein stan [Saccostrea cucullata]|uniref:protocadherin-like wing polarity protein stan n=1 Tax=Saccostrea cuccullata TaxID=36930 RepID=UPI002ED229A1
MKIPPWDNPYYKLLSQTPNQAHSGILTTSSVHNIDFDILPTTDIRLVVYSTDGIAVASQTGTIRIADVNEACYFAEDYYRIIREEGNSGSTFPLPNYNIRDPDAGETFTFQKTCGSPYDNKVSINTNTGQFSFLGNYDLDIPATVTNFNCTLTVRDSGGNSDTAIVGVFIEYKNEFSPVFSAATVSLTLQSHELIGAIVTNFTAHDNDLSTNPQGQFYYVLDQSSNSKEYFGIMSNGSIYIKEDLTPLYLGKTLRLTLTAKDYGTPSRQSSVSITIQIPLSTTTSYASPTDKALEFENDTRNSSILALGGFLFLGMLCTTAFIIYKYTIRGKRLCKTKQKLNVSKSRLLKVQNVSSESTNHKVEEDDSINTRKESEFPADVKKPMPVLTTTREDEFKPNYPVYDGVDQNKEKERMFNVGGYVALAKIIQNTAVADI